MQAKKLRKHKKQKKYPGQIRKKQTLQVLPKAYLAQRNEMIAM
jgi:hypothetical protein